jgi:hypothetical protein
MGTRLQIGTVSGRAERRVPLWPGPGPREVTIAISPARRATRDAESEARPKGPARVAGMAA